MHTLTSSHPEEWLLWRSSSSIKSQLSFAFFAFYLGLFARVVVVPLVNILVLAQLFLFEFSVAFHISVNSFSFVSL